jgi:hypothetical protein
MIYSGYTPSIRISTLFYSFTGKKERRSSFFSESTNRLKPAEIQRPKKPASSPFFHLKTAWF